MREKISRLLGILSAFKERKSYVRTYTIRCELRLSKMDKLNKTDSATDTSVKFELNNEIESLNKEISDIKKILGLEMNREYKTIEDVHKHLRYSKVG